MRCKSARFTSHSSPPTEGQRTRDDRGGLSSRREDVPSRTGPRRWSVFQGNTGAGVAATQMYRYHDNGAVGDDRTGVAATWGHGESGTVATNGGRTAARRE